MRGRNSLSAGTGKINVFQEIQIPLIFLLILGLLYKFGWL